MPYVDSPARAKEHLKTIKLRNHRLTMLVWPEGGRILEVQSLETGRHMVSWWPFKTDTPERAGGIGESATPAGAGPWTVRELPDRVLLTRDLSGGLTLKKSIFLPPDSCVFHVSLSLANTSQEARTFAWDQTAALCPGFGGATPRADSGILHCRHKAFLKRPEEEVLEVPYEVFERVHVERDDLEWAAFNDPVGDSLVCAILPPGHVTLRSEYHWWLEWTRTIRVQPGATVSADFHYAVTGSVDLPLVVGEHFAAGLVGATGAAWASTLEPRVRVFGLDGGAAASAVSVAVDGKGVVLEKPLPDSREAFDVELPGWHPEHALRIEVTLGAKFGSAVLSPGRCRRLFAELDAVCGEALAAADAGRISNAKVASVLAYKRIAEANAGKSPAQLEGVIEHALISARAVLASPAEAVPFYGEEHRRWQMAASGGIDLEDAGARIWAELSMPYDLSIPRFREPKEDEGAFALAGSLFEAALFLSVRRDGRLVELFKARLGEMTELWARHGEILYETIHHGVVVSSLIPAVALACEHGWLPRVDQVEAQAMIIDLCGKIRRQGGIQFRLSNWWAMESAALGYAGALFPYLPEAKEYLDTARETFYWLLVHGTMADGGFWEMSPSYHELTLRFLAHIAEGMRLAGEDLYRDDVCGRRLSDMADFVKRIAVPPGRLPAFDDSHREFPPEMMLLVAKRLGDAELLYHADAAFVRMGRTRGVYELTAASPGLEPVEPKRASEVLQPSGKAVLRSASRDMTLVMDFGPHGGWHGHNDKLSFELFWRDRCLIPDAGSYKYEEPLHWSWFKTAAAHNTVTVGDGDQLPCCGKFVHFVESGGVAMVAACARTYPGVTHRREITLGDRMLLVDDFLENAPAGETLVWRLNSSAPITVKGEAAFIAQRDVGMTLTALGGDVSLSTAEVALMPEAVSPGGEYVRGWQLRISKKVAHESERFLVKLEFQW